MWQGSLATTLLERLGDKSTKYIDFWIRGMIEVWYIMNKKSNI